MPKRIPILLLFALVSIMSLSQRQTAMRQETPQKEKTHSSHSLNGFVENQGQWNSTAKFVFRQGFFVAGLNEEGILLKLTSEEQQKEGQGYVIGLKFEGVLDTVTLKGEDICPGRYNFFYGQDPRQWKSNVTAYASVRYEGLYQDIDLRVRESNQGGLEYDLYLSPNADLNDIVVQVEGADQLELISQDSLQMKTPLGVLHQAIPLAWYELPQGKRQPVKVAFRLMDKTHYGFKLLEPRKELALVIDPSLKWTLELQTGLKWSTYLGGSQYDAPFAMAMDNSGDIIVAGITGSADFPVQFGPYSSYRGGTSDAFVSRLSADGTTLIYSTFLGGTDSDSVSALALSVYGDVVVGGYTASSDFPTTPGAYDESFNDFGCGGADAFVASLSADGTSLIYSTFLGGINSDKISDLAVDRFGVVTATGSSTSPDFPVTTNAYDSDLNGPPVCPGAGGCPVPCPDAFVVRLSPQGNGQNDLIYSTFFGGSDSDIALAMAMDAVGDVIIGGDTRSFDLPTTPGAFDQDYDGPIPFPDGFIAKLHLQGSGTNDLVYSTFLGRAGDGSSPFQGQDYVQNIALDKFGIVTVVSQTTSSNFPTTLGAFDTTFNSICDASACYEDTAVSQLKLDGQGPEDLIYSTFLGGSYNDTVADVVVDSSGNVIVAGSTDSADFPTTKGAFDRSFNDLNIPPQNSDAFLCRLSVNRGSLLYSTYFGGAKTDLIKAVSFDEQTGIATFSGATWSKNFPTTFSAFDRTYNDTVYADVFVSRLNIVPK